MGIIGRMLLAFACIVQLLSCNYKIASLFYPETVKRQSWSFSVVLCGSATRRLAVTLEDWHTHTHFHMISHTKDMREVLSLASTIISYTVFTHRLFVMPDPPKKA